jgi:hypothetical protein
MAKPTSIDLPKNEWIEITDKNCIFQNKGNFPIYISPNADVPTTTREAFAYEGGEKGSYTADSDKLYAMNPYSTNHHITIQEV